MKPFGWTLGRVKHVQELAGTVGRQPGEPPIASMGSTGPPHVEDPLLIRDRLVCDGAQVTRPSIDPYREPVETHVYLCGGKIRLSMPVVVKIRASHPPYFSEAVVKAAYYMGVLADVSEAGLENFEKYRDGLLADVSYAGVGGCAGYVSSFYGLRRLSVPVFVKAPPAESYPWLKAAAENGMSGVLVDEELVGDTSLEVGVSVVDRELRSLGLRNEVSVLAGGWSVRGSDDIYKLVALGADAVVLSNAVEYAVGYPDAKARADVLRERMENLLLGLQRELKLLAGAAGVSSVFNSLVGNRELLRAVELDREIRLKLGVKQAGVG
ncbi:MAG: glutamate synthase-related protein [Candidatus Caldarchaeum sp.]|nr:glutamate synthase-related protein [Candidatus Caldarchaeum sp.]